MGTNAVYVRRRRPVKGQPTAYSLHAERDCPALVTVADTQLVLFHGSATQAIRLLSDQNAERAETTAVFELCACLTPYPGRLPTRPPLHARITVERCPDGLC